jgi:hypothetical protein
MIKFNFLKKETPYANNLWLKLDKKKMDEERSASWMGSEGNMPLATSK